uniref:Uncharacterized protein n=1 Tax=Lygus hesperus TaxID=30085 RepID=A0A0K8ST64_LYGHE
MVFGRGSYRKSNAKDQTSLETIKKSKLLLRRLIQHLDRRRLHQTHRTLRRMNDRLLCQLDSNKKQQQSDKVPHPMENPNLETGSVLQEKNCHFTTETMQKISYQRRKVMLNYLQSKTAFEFLDRIVE